MANYDSPHYDGGPPVLRVAPAGRAAADDHRLERLLERLPQGWQQALRWLRRPGAGWARIPAGLLLIVGGVLSILPVLGLWMLPLGLILLAEDVPALQRSRGRLLDWLERRRPHWFAADPAQINRKTDGDWT